MPRFLCLLLVFLCTRVPAQDFLTPRVRSFSSADYQADNQNWDITQSPDGVLYVANSGGVLRFDGLGWTVHQLPGQPTVRAVAWVGDRLYVGGYGEFGYFATDDGLLGNYTSLSADLPAEDRTQEIWHIEGLPGGGVVFQSFSRLYRYTAGGLTTQVSQGILFAHATDGGLLVPVIEGGLDRYTNEKAEATRLSTSDRLIVALTGQGDSLRLATADSLFVRKGERLQPWSARANALLQGHRINRLLALADGTLAVGTIKSGVYLFTAEGRLAYHLDYGSGLSNSTVLALFEDRAGNLWVGLDRGLDLVVRSEPLRFFRSGNRSIGAVYAAATYGGLFYVGTNQGLFAADSLGELTFVEGTAGQVWELRPTARGLLCGHNTGTFLVNGRQARLVTDRSGGWQTLAVPFDSTAFLQANYTGLSYLQLGGDAGAEYKLPELLAPLRQLSLTGKDRLLALHGSRGAYRITLSEDWRHITDIDTVRQPDLVRPFLAAFGDTLLVQSPSRVYRYERDSFVALSEFRGVPLPEGTSILPGRAGSDEWFIVARDRISVYRGGSFLAAYPLQLRRMPTVIPLAEGEYLLCLEEGYALYHPQPPTTDRPALALHASRPTAGVWRFDYALPALDRTVRYRHRLRGFDDNWSEWSTRGRWEVTNLDGADYVFEVEADWYGAAAETAFTVPPPWYRSWWAYLGYASLFCGLTYLLYREHLRQLAIQSRRMEVVRLRELNRQRIEADNARLEEENQRKSRELANTTLTLAKKNEMLLGLKEELSDNSPKLLHLIDRNLNNEEDWAIFESHFNEVHEAFLNRLKGAHPDLTRGDLQLAAYLKMDLSSKEIAPLLHISVRGVENKRYRLRKKLTLDSNDNLNEYVREL